MKHETKYNTVSNLFFTSNKTSRRIAVLLIAIIDIGAVVSAIFCGQLFNANLLKDLSQLSITVVLAIVALGISVFQSDNLLAGKGNSDENKQVLYLKYVFGMFPTILVSILGFFVAVWYGEYGFVIRIYSVAMILMITRSISGTLAAFVAFLNIRD